LIETTQTRSAYGQVMNKRARGPIAPVSTCQHLSAPVSTCQQLSATVSKFRCWRLCLCSSGTNSNGRQ
jgi:hypothetical protein